jgi:hypothetical protein
MVHSEMLTCFECIILNSIINDKRTSQSVVLGKGKKMVSEGEMVRVLRRGKGKTKDGIIRRGEGNNIGYGMEGQT